MDDQPNDLDDAIIIDESEGHPAVNPSIKLQTEIVTTTEDSRISSLRTPPETKLPSSRSDVITIDASATTASLFARLCLHRQRSGKSNAVDDRLCWMV